MLHSHFNRLFFCFLLFIYWKNYLTISINTNEKEKWMNKKEIINEFALALIIRRTTLDNGLTAFKFRGKIAYGRTSRNCRDETNTLNTISVSLIFIIGKLRVAPLPLDLVHLYFVRKSIFMEYVHVLSVIVYINFVCMCLWSVY